MSEIPKETGHITAADELSIAELARLTQKMNMPASKIVEEEDGSLKRVESFRDGRFALQTIKRDGKILEDVRIDTTVGSRLDAEG